MPENMRIQRSIHEPIKNFSSWDEQWKGEDLGIISSWQTGREKAITDIDMATQAKNGELMVLCWRGGLEKPIKSIKFGSLYYLAMWQGLRGEDLDIDTDKEVSFTCTKTGTTVIYTKDLQKFGNDAKDNELNL